MFDYCWFDFTDFSFRYVKRRNNGIKTTPGAWRTRGGEEHCLHEVMISRGRARILLSCYEGRRSR